MDDFDRYVFIELPEWLHELLSGFAETQGVTVEDACVSLLVDAVRIANERATDGPS